MQQVEPPRAATRQRLGDLLVASGFATEAEISAALTQQRQTGERLGPP